MVIFVSPVVKFYRSLSGPSTGLFVNYVQYNEAEARNSFQKMDVRDMQRNDHLRRPLLRLAFRSCFKRTSSRLYVLFKGIAQL